MINMKCNYPHIVTYAGGSCVYDKYGMQEASPTPSSVEKVSS